MKILLTTTMALSILALLEQNVQALNYKSPTLQLARGGGHGAGRSEERGRSEGRNGGRSEGQSVGRAEGNVAGDHTNNPETRLHQNLNRNDRNWGNLGGGWDGVGDLDDSGCWTDVNGNVNCGVQ